MKEAIKRLKQLLNWSDRLGSDEIFEIQQIIKILEEENETSQKFYNSNGNILNKKKQKL